VEIRPDVGADGRLALPRATVNQGGAISGV
jgi:hypothetical protein